LERVLGCISDVEGEMLKTTGFCLAVLLVMTGFAAAQNEPVPSPFTCTMLATARTQEEGCYIVATEQLEHLPAGSLFWHLYTYPALQAAKQAQRKSGGVVAESFGKTWLFKIADANWRPESGERVAVIGPLEVSPGKRYEARYLEGAIPTGRPGTPVHRHPGPEAWYVLSGAQCMQTPGKTELVRAHGTAVIPGGTPMKVSFPLTVTTRQIVLVLFDASQPWRTKAQDWQPTDACPSQ
jgi:mannose-6-phosphate isomerase-like protein (cupin superfamily)